MDEYFQGKDKATYPLTFEETYPRYEFAELVRLAMGAGAWLAKVRRRLERRRPDTPGKALPGAMKPAE